MCERDELGIIDEFNVEEPQGCVNNGIQKDLDRTEWKMMETSHRGE